MTCDLARSTLHQITIPVGDRDREFLVYLPESFPSDGPMVFVFHGAGSCAQVMVDFCGMNDTADEHGFGIVYPSGTGRSAATASWNADGANVYAARHNVDDLGFTSALLDWLSEHVEHDRSRVYAAGMSNGGLFCYQLAVTMPERFAAIAPVAVAMASIPKEVVGRTGIGLVSGNAPQQVMPLLHMHGTSDNYVLYEGGMGRKSLTNTAFASVEETVRYWAGVNGCDPMPVVTELPILVDDGTRVTQHTFSGGRADVVLYQVHNGGHTWPGQSCPYDFLGIVTQNLVANETIWDFFRTKARPF